MKNILRVNFLKICRYIRMINYINIIRMITTIFYAQNIKIKRHYKHEIDRDFGKYKFSSEVGKLILILYAVESISQ